MRLERDALLNTALVIVASCAVVTTALAAYRTLRPAAPRVAPAVVEIDGWKQYAKAGQRLGPTDAPAVIVAFSDFECPFCKTAAQTLRAIRDKYGDRVALVYRHFPLEKRHPLARTAAIASECASRQARFEAFHDALFAEDSLVADHWGELAAMAGIADTVAFNACLVDPVAAATVDKDVLAGSQLGIEGTPTILVNQYRVMAGAPGHVIDSLVQVAIRRR